MIKKPCKRSLAIFLLSAQVWEFQTLCVWNVRYTKMTGFIIRCGKTQGRFSKGAWESCQDSPSNVKQQSGPSDLKRSWKQVRNWATIALQDRSVIRFHKPVPPVYSPYTFGNICMINFIQMCYRSFTDTQNWDPPHRLNFNSWWCPRRTVTYTLHAGDGIRHHPGRFKII